MPPDDPPPPGVDPTGLHDALESLFDSPGSTTAACAASWAAAATTYATGVKPKSTAVAGAEAALRGALKAAFDLHSTDAAAAMETAFTAWAAAIGGGMAGFVPTPPPAAVGFAALLSEPYPSSHAASADMLSQAIDTWFRTGTSTPSSGGGPIVWS